MITKTTISFFAFVLLAVLLWVVYPRPLLAQNELLPPLTYNSLPSQTIASGETAMYTHLLVNNRSESVTLTLTAESASGWYASVAPSTLLIGANNARQIHIRHTAPRSVGNGEEDAATVTIQGAESDVEIVNQTEIDGSYGFTVAVSPDTIYTQPDATLHYDVEITHLSVLADEIDVRVIGVTQPLTATVESGIGRIIPVSGTLNSRLVVDVPQGTIDGTAGIITFTVTSVHLSERQYTRQLTVQTIVGDAPPTPVPTPTAWGFPTPEVTIAPTSTPTPLPFSIVTRDTSVWDQPYPAMWVLPITRLDAGDEVSVLYETFEWIEISWDDGAGWVPIGVVTDTIIAEATETEAVPLAITHSEMKSNGQGVVWGVIVAAVCTLIPLTLRMLPKE